ncbi:hypothetical protein M9458_034729, partial [Cirrhinus mrigala]
SHKPSHLVFHTGVTPDAEFGLSSLELLNYEDPCLSPVAFNGLSSLTKLTVHYKQWLETSKLCRLTEWLQGLHALSELNISCKYEKIHNRFFTVALEKTEKAL